MPLAIFWRRCATISNSRSDAEAYRRNAANRWLRLLSRSCPLVTKNGGSRQKSCGNSGNHSPAPMFERRSCQDGASKAKLSAFGRRREVPLVGYRVHTQHLKRESIITYRSIIDL